MTSKNRLSVIIATHNEEANLGKCLESVRDLADEIIVADGESTDRTVEIAKSFGATVLPMSNKRMFHFNKQEASDHARGEWLLFLDADEIVTEELAEEIRKVMEGTHTDWFHREGRSKEKKWFTAHMKAIEQRDHVTFSTAPPIHGYFIARKNFFLGRYLMHSGVYPDGVIRLVKKGTAYWPCKDVHETMIVQGGVSWLKNAMIHMADPTFKRYLMRANRYTSLTADALEKQHVSTSLPSVLYYIIVKPLFTFFLLFIRHKGFLDGFSGFIWALMSGLHWSIAYIKYMERKIT